MYNLFVSGDCGAWEGETLLLELSRCVREYTAVEITEKFGAFHEEAKAELKRFPCIFAYEASCQKDPKFGVLSSISKRNDQVRIQYEIRKIEPFLKFEDLATLGIELDIDKWEMNRTHWAVKNVNLARELKLAYGLDLPPWARSISKSVNIDTHVFDVALSFPGEIRELVESIAIELERLIGPHSYFYDKNYEAQLARPSLDILLQAIYGRRSKLVVVFLSRDYQRKDWCGIEFRAIRDIILERENSKVKVMFVRTDDGEVEGVFKTDGYIDAQKYSPEEIAGFISQRVDLLR